ncbi:FUSC family protein [Niallia sp. XMNu-256]|uniref:FUSC family protein n=1 Tax=Niallia sp. XMNu-256 TaxID=3082444 RepID=UPI0030D0FBFC
MNKIKLTGPEKWILILKIVIGSAISWELSIFFGSKYPYLGPISLILCLQATIFKSIRFGVARILGTIIGGVSVYILASSLHANGLSIALIMLVSLIFPFFLRANGTTLHQIALSVLLVLEFEHKLSGYGLDRVRDSIIGVVVALILQYVYPPNFTKKAIHHVDGLPNLLAKSLKSLAAWIDAGALQQNYFKQQFNYIHQELQESEKQIQKAKLSLKFNPFAHKSQSQLQDGETLVKTLNGVGNDIYFLYTIIDEWSKSGTFTKEDKKAWTQNFSLLETSLRNWNEEKEIPEVHFIETVLNLNFNIPAIWHTQHLIRTLKQNPHPVFFP